MSSGEASRLAAAVVDADALLGDDFGGEKRSLGRPWYTHLESGRAAEYFADVAASDDENEARTVTDGREDGKWRVGGTLKVGSSSSPSLLNSSLPSFFLPSSSSSLDPSHPTVP